MLEIQNNKEFMSQRCDETMKDDYKAIIKIIRAMEESLINSNVNYLVASQLGLNERIIMVKYENNEIHTFINPIITDYSKKAFLSREKDLFDGKEYLIPRKEIIEITFTNKSGVFKKIIYKAAAAALLQNLMDLLEGVFVSDIGLEILPGFDEISEEEKEEIINMYFESLKLQQEELKEEIKTNEYLSYIEDTINKISAQFKEEDEKIEQQEILNREQKRKINKWSKKIQKHLQSKENDSKEENKNDKNSA